MFNVGGGEVIIIMLVALIVLGPAKLPEVARQIGRATKTLRAISNGFQDEMKRAMEDPVEAMARERGNKVVASEQAAAPETDTTETETSEAASAEAEESSSGAAEPGTDSVADEADGAKAQDDDRVDPSTPSTGSGTGNPRVSTAAAAGMYDPFAGKVADGAPVAAETAAIGAESSEDDEDDESLSASTDL